MDRDLEEKRLEKTTRGRGSTELEGIYRVFFVVAGEGRITLLDRIMKSEDPDDLIATFYEALRMAKSIEKNIEISEEEIEEVMKRPRVLKRLAVRAAAVAYRRESEQQKKEKEKAEEVSEGG
ncbi:hypothetical protein ATG_05840 [Desulfurococcaceae archaeon AG1]|nr:hypothetical protein ATG_05840 [Desulfurococcaceae archaeon AG1]